jgi:cytochrome P450
MKPPLSVQTAYATASLLYHLAKNPDKQQKLFEEIQRYLPDKDQPLTSDILNELRYLKACIKESMRSVLNVTLLYFISISKEVISKDWNTGIRILAMVVCFLYLYVHAGFWI